MLRNTLAVCALLVLGASSQAAIILQNSAPTPAQLADWLALRSLWWARPVKSSTRLPAQYLTRLSVAWVFITLRRRSRTPRHRPRSTHPRLWNHGWTPYDTYFMYNDARLSAGPTFADTKMELPRVRSVCPTFRRNPTSGFGTLTVAKARRLFLRRMPTAAFQSCMSYCEPKMRPSWTSALTVSLPLAVVRSKRSRISASKAFPNQQALPWSVWPSPVASASSAVANHDSFVTI